MAPMLYPEKTFINICDVLIHHVKREATHLADRVRTAYFFLKE
uniref:Uncharacterized protein n=1 Tax=Utricularia reniformis TaxID=192314 RepID=A0A1Y0AZQ5_9LAMI|nr:hypothetical protein AEK19_MT0358 [Utricularia reniformis]ART30630.1 hypothetical protein AEK19_MT0358 [Utricularia reniformis]